MKARFLVTALTMATALMAQGPGGGGFHRDSLTPHTPPTAAELVTREVNFLTKFFGLTGNQPDQVSMILTTEQGCLANGTTALQTARAALVTAIKSGSETNIATAIAGLHTAQAAQDTCRATAAASIYTTVLTSAQQMKIGNGLGPLLGGGIGRGPGGPGPR
jgi:hypothetical protein